MPLLDGKHVDVGQINPAKHKCVGYIYVGHELLYVTIQVGSDIPPLKDQEHTKEQIRKALTSEARRCKTDAGDCILRCVANWITEGETHVMRCETLHEAVDALVAAHRRTEP